MHHKRASTRQRYLRHRREVVAYGGELLRTRLGRSTPRPLSPARSLHIVMRASCARGERSFRHRRNLTRVDAILRRFAHKHGVTFHDFAVHFNHIHLYARIESARGYKRFIRAVTSAIATAVWRGKKKFWDRCPFTRIIFGAAEARRMWDYIQINKLETQGWSRERAKSYLKNWWQWWKQKTRA